MFMKEVTVFRMESYCILTNPPDAEVRCDFDEECTCNKVSF